MRRRQPPLDIGVVLPAAPGRRRRRLHRRQRRHDRPHVASGRHMRDRVRQPDGEFRWNGRRTTARSRRTAPTTSGSRCVSRAARSNSTQAGHVETVPPRPRVTSVSPSLIPANGAPVTMHYRGNERRAGTVLVYRTDLPATPRLVDSIPTNPHVPATWNGTINGRPAPAGTYLIGLRVVDRACNVGRFPATLPPAPGSTPHAGVTVRYLAAQPPMAPVTAGVTRARLRRLPAAPVHVDADARRGAQAGRARLRSCGGAPRPAPTVARRRAVRACAALRRRTTRRCRSWPTPRLRDRTSSSSCRPSPGRASTRSTTMATAFPTR